MPDNRLQRLVNAVKLRFQAIRIANGYNSDLGLRVHLWRDSEAVPFQDDELPALNFRDKSAEVEQRLSGIHDHEITFEVDVITNKFTLDHEARRLLADVIQAIGVDRQWTEPTDDPEVTPIKLAVDTLPVRWEFGVTATGKALAGCRYVFMVRQRTRSFDPYTTQ